MTDRREAAPSPLDDAFLASLPRLEFALARTRPSEGDASGRAEVFLAPLEGGPSSNRWQISAGGGTSPAFGPDGRRIYFRGPDDDILSVDGDFGGTSPAVGPARALFRVPSPLIGSNRNTFMPAPDGQSLIVARPESAGTLAVHVIAGWEPPAHTSSTAR